MACAGIDFGNKNSVVAIARRGGIDVCANEVSNRATPSLVSFLADERHIGESAASMAAQNHRNTVGSIQRLIGVPFDSGFTEEEKKRLTCTLIPHPITKTSSASVNYTGVETEENDSDKNFEGNTIFTFESLCAMLLSKLMDTAITENKAPIRDVVVSVPVYYTHLQRKALLNCAKIANINVLRVMNEHSAIALSYGIFRTKELPDTIPIKVAFVDIGEASTTVSIAAFTNTKCEILSVASDPNLGGRDLDDIIVNTFAAQFKTAYGIDVLSKPKPAARLRKEAEKIKKILSANPESPLNLECLMNDLDVQGHITRDDLEEIAEPLLQKVTEVCEKAMEDAKLKSDEKLFAVELIGGSTRVPAFKSRITEVFSKVGAQLKTTLNADECIARGCALMSAMLSPTFKVRDYAMTDIATHTLLVDKVFSDGSPTESLTIVPKNNAVPCLKVMKFKSPGALTINIKYEDASSLPAAIGGDGQGSMCGGYLVDAPIDPDAKVHAKVRVNASGIVEMASAQLVKEVEEEEEFVVPDDPAPAKEAAAEVDTSKANGDVADKDAPMANSDAKPEGDSEKPKENGAEAPEKKDGETPKDDKMETEGAKKDDKKEEAKKPVVTEKRMVKKKKTIDLVVTPLEVGGCGLTTNLVLAATEKEAKMRAHDTYIRERSEAMNSLEAYVYDLRSRIDEYGGDLKEYGSKDVRSKLKKDLDDAEEWIYSEEAEKASKSMFVEKKGGLMDKGYPLLMRKREFDERPVRIKVLESSIDKYKEVAVGTEEQYAHIKQEEKDKILKCVEDAGIWLKNEKTKQDGLAKNLDPTLTCEILANKLKEIEGVCEPIKNTPKPKTEEEKKKEADAAKAEDPKCCSDESCCPDAEAGKGKEDGDGSSKPGCAKEANDGDKMETEETGTGEEQGKGDKTTNGESKADAEMKD